MRRNTTVIAALSIGAATCLVPAATAHAESATPAVASSAPTSAAVTPAATSTDGSSAPAASAPTTSSTSTGPVGIGSSTGGQTPAVATSTSTVSPTSPAPTSTLTPSSKPTPSPSSGRLLPVSGLTLAVKQAASPVAGRSVVHFGAISYSGKLTGPTGTIVNIYRGISGSSTSALVAHTGVKSDGTFSFSLPATNGAANFTYQAKAGATSSPVVNLPQVLPSMGVTSLTGLNSLATGTSTMTFSPGGTVRAQLQVQVGGTWKTILAAGTSNGSYRAQVTWARGVLASWPMRSMIVAPDGTTISSPVGRLQRIAVLDAVLTPTTYADVKYTYHAGCPVGPASLYTVHMNYIGYDHRLHRGVLILHRKMAASAVAAFKVGMAAGFPIHSELNPNTWFGDDVKMMAANNTSGFNCRHVTGNPTAMSPHSYGNAIDINTYENPYYVGGVWYPSAKYGTYRPASVHGLLVASSSLTKALRGRGWTWLVGFDWQHFQKPF